jgi:predicted CoA-binding protein
MLELIRDKKIKIALIGASNDNLKFGYKIYKDLLSKGYDVTPINPKEIMIEGIRSIQNIELMTKSPDIIDFVIPPKVALEEAKKLQRNGYNNFWFQPGSESNELIDYLKTTNLNYLVNECIMDETN